MIGILCLLRVVLFGPPLQEDCAKFSIDGIQMELFTVRIGDYGGASLGASAAEHESKEVHESLFIRLVFVLILGNLQDKTPSRNTVYTKCFVYGNYLLLEEFVNDKMNNSLTDTPI